MPNHKGIDERILDPICCNLNNPDCVSDDLLWWHFQQCVLINMWGIEEPVFETDFPDGTDMMATLCTEPYDKERFEMKLETRLRLAEQGGVQS